MLSILNVTLGGSLLLLGRKLFWLLLGALGFVTGVEVSTRFVRGSEVSVVLGAIALGIAFALLAIFVQSAAIGLAGFLGGGYAVLSLADLLGLQGRVPQIAAFAVGGILGVILIVLLFDWALVSISSLAGASMIVRGLPLAPASRAPAYLILLLVGVLVQGFALRREKAARKAHPA
jgi:hypothetical protein